MEIFLRDVLADNMQMQYWLTNCSNYCLGLFITAEESDAATFATARPVDSYHPERKSILIAHIIATKTTNTTIQNDDLELPYNPPREHEPRGHKEHGDSIFIQSMSVLPEYRRIGGGKSLLREYCERQGRAGTAHAVAALADATYFQFYQSLGFQVVYGSPVRVCGEEWKELRVNLGRF